MLSFVFWNTGRRRIGSLISELAHSSGADVVLLAESEDPPASLLRELNQRSVAYRFHPSPSDRIRIFSRLPSRSIKLVRDTGGVSIRRVSPPLGSEILLVVVHLPSKLHYDGDDQAMFSVRVAQYIREAEERAAHARTIVVGDLNMNPFEPGVAGCEGFHAVSTRGVASEGRRRVQQVDRPFFYNPMWAFFGDRAGRPPGTYFFRASTPVAYFWNLFDQVLIRPALLSHFRDEDLSIVTQIGSVSLISEEGIPNPDVGSDHLPLLFRLTSDI